MGQATAGMRLQKNVFVARNGLIEFDPRHNAIHPIANRSVGVMIEGIHRRALKTAVRLDAVPTLPDGRGAFRHGIEPGGIFFAVQEHVRFVQIAIIAKRLAQQRRAQESRGQVAEFSDVGGQAGGGFGAL